MNLTRLKFNNILSSLFVCFLINIQVNKYAEGKYIITGKPRQTQHWNRNNIAGWQDNVIQADPRNSGFNDMVNSNKLPDQEINCARDKDSNNKGVCKTTACKTEASHLLCRIDHSADYDNFYEYACGGMKHNTEFLESDSNAPIYKIIKDELKKTDPAKSSGYEKNLKTFYDSCLDYKNIPFEERVEKGKQILEHLNLKYVTENDTYDSISFTNTIVSLIKLDSFPIFDVGLEIDHKDTSQMAIKLSLSLEDYSFEIEKEKEINCKTDKKYKYSTVSLENLYRNYKKCMKNHTEYFKDTEDALSTFNVFGDKQNSNDVTKLVEKQLIPIINMRMDNGDIYKTEYYTVRRLQDTFSTVNWNLLFSALLNKTISDDERVQVYYEEDLEDIFRRFINEKDLWKLNNALLANLAQNIYKYFVKPENPCYDREKFCLEITSRLIPDVISNSLMKKTDSEELKNQESEVAKIYELIRSTLLNEVQEVSTKWLDEESVEAIKKKTLSSKFVLPPLQLKFDTIFNFEQESMGNNYFINAMKLIQRKKLLLNSLHNMDSDSPEVIWTLYSRAYSKDSVYIYEINTLAISEKQVLDYNKELPDAITMARLGHEIASGFSRAFDKTGIKFDYKNKQMGSGKSLLTYQSHSSFEGTVSLADNALEDIRETEDNVLFALQRPRELQKQRLSSLVLNGKLSDASATKLAFETLLRRSKQDSQVLLWGDFTKEQLYFLSLAQRFCTKKTILDLFPDLFQKGSRPPFIRLRNIINNSEEFYSHFPTSKASENSKIKPFPYYIKHGGGKIES